MSRPFHTMLSLTLAGIITLSIGGCASYVTPGGPAPMSAFTDPEIQERIALRPVPVFPAHIVAAHVQCDGYRSHTREGYGSGRFSVITSREAEKDVDLERLAKLPGVAGLMPINRLLIPDRNLTGKDLCVAAATLHADVLVIYTYDTTFRVRDHEVGPLGPIFLGFLPNHEAKVTSVASALFVDVRTGYVYGAAEGTASVSQLSSLWTQEDVVDECRIEAESKAFKALVDEMAKTWAGIVAQYGKPSATGANPEPATRF